MLDSETKDLIRSDKLNHGFGRGVFRYWLSMLFGKNYLVTTTLKCLITSRKHSYYLSHKNCIINKIASIFYAYRYYFLSSRYGMEILAKKMGKNVRFWHLGIIISCHSIIGDGCTFHGNNCIGNNGHDLLDVPIIGNNVDIGFGACIIGKVRIADNIVIGANAVVNKSFTEPNIIIGGIPAIKIGERTDF